MKLILSLSMVLLFGLNLKAEETKLPAEQMSHEILEDLSQEEINEILDIELEAKSRGSDFIRDLIIDSVLDRHVGKRVVCEARNRRGRIYTARGRHPRYVQDKALRRCDRQSRRACYALGCYRVRR